jgi:hypothetical protein
MLLSTELELSLSIWRDSYTGCHGGEAQGWPCCGLPGCWGVTEGVEWLQSLALLPS